MFLGQLRSRLSPKEEESAEIAQKAPQAKSSIEEFLKSSDAKAMVERWNSKQRGGAPLYTKRGVVRLLRELHSGYESDAKTLKSAEIILKMLGGEDKLQGFLAGWKAKSEGIMKGIKSVLGGS